ncbi:MAG: hypothetical protein AB199_00670 [Parcubacteria bacterium C7867-004]|nr:MAG: hypothetical protein AB199_00670 [Parcubacteria bacterium C7867-004]
MIMKPHSSSVRPVRGYLIITALVFGSIFVTVLGALASSVLIENRAQSQASSGTRGLAIAEAGLEYYRWFLAHYPTDVQNGTGAAGPYVMPYNDPEGGQTGTISLSIVGNSSCGQLTSIDITSTGTPIESPSAARTLKARYARPTVALFSYVLNSSVWAGPDRIINGPYHSNGGIRMDGTANAPVTSSLATWLCTSSFGCATNQTKDGVWGAGPNSDLWTYPVPQVDFSGIAADFTTLRTTAIASGKYLPRYSSSSSDANASRGYRLIFNGDGTVTIRRVNTTTAFNATIVSTSLGGIDRSMITAGGDSFFETYIIPASCGLIFVEDNVWIEGVVDRKVTVVAANVTTTGIAPNAVLNNNITYGATDGSDGLTLMAENNIVIPPNSPYDMNVSGVFIAQNGYFGRNLFPCSGGYEPRGTLTILGTTVSNLRTGTRWPTACSGTGGGYQTRIDAYDRKLSTDPPPFTPQTSTDYYFVDWREQ